MRNQAVAQRYAEALFQVASAQGTLDKVDAELASLSQLLSENKELVSFLASPIVEAEDKKQVVTQLFTGKVDAMVFNTMLLMLDKKRGEAVSALHEAFRTLFNDYRKRTKVRVVSALPMDEQEVAGIKRELAKATSREIEMEVAIDPEIIGGLVVSIGDQVIDSSLKGRLESLARTLA